jgi:class 3 adenylate cyclase/tetratricopeptide (TPR) repeat protein
VQEIAEWLQKLDLGQYAQLFAENKIDVSVLPHLTDDDLKGLGVPLGHRRKILAAINPGVESVSPIAAVPTGIEPRTTEAERRYVTVLFSDLVGSTALSAHIDPEDLRDVISAYQQCVAETVHRFGGFVAKYMGDGVLVYFGYPEAHEDDPERAVRAGLELVAAISRLQTHASLQSRVGIATGLVVVGELVGSGAAQEQAIVGKTPNLAARLQTIAEPDGVVIAESTHKLIGNLFELEDLGAKDLKGFSGGERAWAVLRASSVASRFEALHASGLTELVGRQEELDLLLRRWAKVVAGEGQVVLLSGEAGIGKSRLTAALQDRLATEPHTRLRYFCSPQHTDSALYPIISQMARAARFAHGDSAQTRLDKLDAVLDRSYTPPQDRALFAELLSLANDGRYPKADLTPQQRRERTLEALITQIVALAEQNPLLMIFEDIHWIDPTSLEALGRGVDRIKSVGVLLITTYRPEFEAPWIGRPYVTVLTLNQLGEREIAAMIDSVAGNTLVPDSIRQDIIERTDGIPLFVEEMTKAVLEAVGEGAAERTVAAAPSSSVAVPASLHASLMARLDRLGSAKVIAQIGAVIGREFPQHLLAAVARKSHPDLEADLERLIAAGLLFRHGIAPDAIYLFKHALVQDAAYSTLLRGARQQLHERIVGALEEGFPEIVAAQPELLARHCTEAGLEKQAITYWRTAGEKAVRRASNREALGHFRQALALNEKQASSVDRSLTELAILSQLGPALMSVHGWSAAEVGAAFERAEHLARELESSTDLAPPLAGLWLFHVARGQFSRAEKISEELFNVAHTLQDPDVLLQAHHCTWPICWFRGALNDAKSHAEAGIGLYDEARHASHRFLYLGHDPAVCALSINAIVHWLLGYPLQGMQLERDAIDLARRLQHAPSLAHALWFVCQAQITRGDAAAAKETANALLALSEEHGLPQTRATALVYLGWAVGQTDDFRSGMRPLEEGLALYNRLGARAHLCLITCLLAETYLKTGQYQKAIEQADLAIAISSELGDRWCLPRIHTVRARILQALDQVDGTEVALRMTVGIAAAQSAKGAELHAANALARLWRDHGKPQQARELLASVYGWFSEGFDTSDLLEAKALLDTLAP